MCEMLAAWMGETSVRVSKQEYVTMNTLKLAMEEVKIDLKRPHNARLFTQDWLICVAMKDLANYYWHEGAKSCVKDKEQVVRGSA